MREASSPSRQSSPLVVFSIIGWVLALVLLGIVLWMWSVEAARPGAKTLVPTAGAAFEALGKLFEGAPFWHATGATLRTWLISFVLAAALGLPIGILAGRNRALSAVFGPTLLLIATLPAPLLVLLFIAWEGLNSDTGGIVAAGLIAFAAIVAIAATGQRIGDAVASWRAALRALEIGAVLALATVIFAEGLASRDRLGALALQAFSNYDMPQTFALILFIWMLGLLMALPFALARWILALKR